MRRAGLRVRVVAGFVAGALALSATMALASYQAARQSLVNEREHTAVRAAYDDAAVVRAGLGATSRPDVAAVLRVLDAAGTAAVQRVRTDGHVSIVVAVPLAPATSSTRSTRYGSWSTP